MVIKKTSEISERVRSKSHNLTVLTNLTTKNNEGKMATAKQIEANRINAQLSTGPKSDEGKAIVSYNAVKHGILTEEVYVAEEMQEDFLRLKEGFYSEFQPGNNMEYFLLDRVISCAWRLALLTRVEAEIFVSASTFWKITRIKAAFEGYSCSYMATISRYEKAIENSYYRAMEELRKAQLTWKKVDVIDMSSSVEIGFVS